MGASMSLVRRLKPKIDHNLWDVVQLDYYIRRPPPLSREEALARIKLHQGNLLDLEVDTIVNPTSAELRFSGTIGRQLVQRLGSRLEERLPKNSDYKVGQALAIAADPLPARYLILTPTQKRDYSPHTVSSVKRGAMAALAEAESLSGVQTIAFPSLGTGAAALKAADVAPAILEAVISHLEQGSRLKEVIFAFINQDAYQAYLDAYQTLRRQINAPVTERVSTTRWYLRLQPLMASALSVGQKITLTFHLSPYEEAGSQPLRVPENTLELTAYIESAGFHLAGEQTRSLPVVNGIPQQTTLQVTLIAVASGEQTVRLLLYPGGRVSGLKPAVLSQSFEVQAPTVLPNIPELIERDAIPSPQPDILLFVTLAETDKHQMLQLYLTCAALGYDRTALEPLELTKADIVALQQAALEVAADANLAAPPDLLASLRAFGGNSF